MSIGLGRAPATALAYMYWLRGWQLPEALETLTSQRRCSPRVEAIRAATADLLTDSRPCQLTVGIRRRGTAQTFQVGGSVGEGCVGGWVDRWGCVDGCGWEGGREGGGGSQGEGRGGTDEAAACGCYIACVLNACVIVCRRHMCVYTHTHAQPQVAGLDVGWHTLLDLKEDPKTKRLQVTRDVLPGTYNFKFIVDGRWVANYDYPTYEVGAALYRAAAGGVVSGRWGLRLPPGGEVGQDGVLTLGCVLTHFSSATGVSVVD